LRGYGINKSREGKLLMWSPLVTNVSGEDSEWFSDFRVVFDEAAVEIAEA